jgi:hypothetical protein
VKPPLMLRNNAYLVANMSPSWPLARPASRIFPHVDGYEKGLAAHRARHIRDDTDALQPRDLVFSTSTILKSL